MLTYERLAAAAAADTVDIANPADAREIVDYLTDEWVRDYRRTVGRSQIVETSTQGFSYLFDLATERLVSAWGLSRGRSSHIRDKSRMAGHPLGGGAAYHRGHAIPHTLGGGTDINLVAQRGSVNIGPFRQLEREAVASPGSLYFTYWTYGPSPGQKPIRSQQGLLKPGGRLQLRDHPN